MIAVEGTRALRYEPEWYLNDEITDYKNVIFIELSKRMTAIDMGNIISEYGDVMVVKDSEMRHFIEF